VIALALAHANYNHYGERYIRSPLAQKGLTAAHVSLAYRNHGSAVEELFGVSEDVNQLTPFSREHTVASDKFALRYMARADYDPSEARRFWGQIRQLNQSRLVRIHPVDETRLRMLEQEIQLLLNSQPQ